MADSIVNNGFICDSSICRLAGILEKSDKNLLTLCYIETYHHCVDDFVILHTTYIHTHFVQISVSTLWICNRTSGGIQTKTYGS